MIRPLALAALVLTLAVPPASASEQLRQLVADDLRRLGFADVDVAGLSGAQLGAIHAVANEKRQGGRRGAIRSILGGSYTIRGLFR